MDKNKLTWVDFYKTFATKLLAYKNDREQLINKLIKVYQDISMKFPKMEKDGSVIDIDPFTVFGLFNKHISDINRKIIITGIAKEFGIDSAIPSDFEGIPILNNQKATFFYFVADRDEKDIDTLWDIFKCALNYADNRTEDNQKQLESLFDSVVKQKGVLWNITMGLYWTRPDTFINLDSRNREYILAEQLLSDDFLNEINYLKEIPTGKQYCKICNVILKQFEDKDRTYKTFPQFSLAAWTTTKAMENDNDDKGFWPSLDEYNPNLSKEDWKKFILEVEKPDHPSPMKMLKGMMELGNKASCKQLAQVYGGNASVYVGCTVNLGKRAKKYFKLPACMDGDQERMFAIPFFGKSIVEEGTRAYIYKMRPELRAALDEIDLSDLSPYYDEDEIAEEIKMTDITKNTILYGPPGTGKTYNTVNYAVAIIENKNLEDVKKEAYSKVFERYNVYKMEGLIEFTTFHQSFGYEEFIEGIRPVMNGTDDEQNDIQYQITPGVFKAFCEKAGRPVLKQQKQDIGINSAPTIWKVSLEGTGDNPTRKECMKNGHIRIGYDVYGEYVTSDTNFEEGGKNVINAFVYKMKKGDIVLSCYSATTVDAIGVVTGEYEWHDEYQHYKRLRKVNWIVKDIREDITEINNGATMTLSSVYKLNIGLSDVMDIITKNAPTTEVVEKRNHVFIIDEINRGNISKIFGELITLIEPTKRIGQPEALKVKLPYSSMLFGVPDNVYLIGTMNTADRSIASIDTALRRRFHFKEMLPDASVLDGVYVDGISIKDIFVKMNKRISVLYDREHTLGHAYFLPLKEDSTIKMLSNIFADNIMPLLQEYFYEDYEKIRLVLGDNNKDNVKDQFIIIEENDYKELFGSDEYGFDESKSYDINKSAFGNINAYRLI